MYIVIAERDDNDMDDDDVTFEMDEEESTDKDRPATEKEVNCLMNKPLFIL